MYVETVSQSPARALIANSTNREYALTAANVVTALATTQPTGDGVFEITGKTALPQLKLFPFGDGAAGGTFTMRLYFWTCYGNDPRTLIWLPVLLVELLCILGDQPGPAGRDQMPSSRLILDSERMCTNLSPISGYASVYSGAGLPAMAVAATMGPTLFQFDFQQIDNVSMNCLWAGV